MKRVAIISQPLRASHCHAYLNSANPGFQPSPSEVHRTRFADDQVVLTSDPSAFDDFEFETRPRVVPVSPPPELLPSSRLTRARLFRRVLGKARSGSPFGRWLERAVKKVAWRLRYLDRLVLILRRRRTQTLSETSITDSALYGKLVEEHEIGEIGEIVVLDVFDLPVALAFARAHDVTILVR